MKTFRRVLAATLVAGALNGAAQAEVIQPVSQFDTWYTFDVDSLLSANQGLQWIDLAAGDSLSFSFTLAAPAVLRVVDGGFAGDRFNVSVNGGSSVLTSPGVSTYPSVNAGLDFDFAWLDARFSKLALTLQAGSYTVTGSLAESVVDEFGQPLNATVGAVMLAPVPEPGTWALMLAGLGALFAMARRRA